MCPMYWLRINSRRQTSITSRRNIFSLQIKPISTRQQTWTLFHTHHKQSRQPQKISQALEVRVSLNSSSRLRARVFHLANFSLYKPLEARLLTALIWALSHINRKESGRTSLVVNSFSINLSRAESIKHSFSPLSLRLVTSSRISQRRQDLSKSMILS